MKKLLAVVLVIAVIAGAIYFAPRLILGRYKDIGIQATEKDFETSLKKTKVNVADINDLNLMNLGQKKFTTKGTVKLDQEFTSEEISALVSKANEANGPIKDVKMNFIGNGQVETSFRISDQAINFIKTSETLKGIKIPGLVFAPFNPQVAALTDFLVNYISGLAGNAAVYAKGNLTKTSANSVNVRIDELQIGSVKMSQDVVRKVESGTRDFVNALITSSNGFSIEELRVEDGKLIYKGTLPAEVTGVK